jgi:hypothetical protein
MMNFKKEIMVDLSLNRSTLIPGLLHSLNICFPWLDARFYWSFQNPTRKILRFPAINFHAFYLVPQLCIEIEHTRTLACCCHFKHLKSEVWKERLFLVIRRWKMMVQIVNLKQHFCQCWRASIL